MISWYFSKCFTAVGRRLSQETLKYRNLKTMSCVTPVDYTHVVKQLEAINFCTRCMCAVGVSGEQSELLANVLIAGDQRGHYSHGLNRIEMYVNDIQSGLCNFKTQPTIVKETVSTALVNGENLLGPVVGDFAMKIAISKAKQTGIGWVAAYASNHYGIAGWYSLMAAQEGLIGISFTNTSPLVYPTRSKQRAMGTNPLTVAAPSAKSGDEFVLDMATSAVALGKLEMCRRRQIPIPHGWGADSEGRSTTDASLAIDKGALFPLGGQESTSGYKGFGLGMMVELFCGILAGGNYGPNIRTWMQTDREANLGQCFAAIDPDAFAPGFRDRLSDYMDTLRNLSRADEDVRILIPGDPERAHLNECESVGGIRYPKVLIESMNQLADRLKIPRMPVFKVL